MKQNCGWLCQNLLCIITGFMFLISVSDKYETNQLEQPWHTMSRTLTTQTVYFSSRGSVLNHIQSAITQMYGDLGLFRSKQHTQLDFYMSICDCNFREFLRVFFIVNLRLEFWKSQSF